MGKLDIKEIANTITRDVFSLEDASQPLKKRVAETLKAVCQDIENLSLEEIVCIISDHNRLKSTKDNNAYAEIMMIFGKNIDENLYESLKRTFCNEDFPFFILKDIDWIIPRISLREIVSAKNDLYINQYIGVFSHNNWLISWSNFIDFIRNTKILHYFNNGRIWDTILLKILSLLYIIFDPKDIKDTKSVFNCMDYGLDYYMSIENLGEMIHYLAYEQIQAMSPEKYKTINMRLLENNIDYIVKNLKLYINQIRNPHITTKPQWYLSDDHQSISELWDQNNHTIDPQDNTTDTFIDTGTLYTTTTTSSIPLKYTIVWTIK